MGVNGIYGLSGSGMDIESMVKVGMMSRQNEYDKMAQKFTKNEWMKADYIELNSKITTFNASTLSQYKMSNTMNAKGAESSSEAVKVSANSTAALMSHRVEVTALSSNAYLVGTNSMTRYDTSTGTAYTSTDEGSSSISLKDVLFKELGTNSSGNVYGSMAPDGVAMVEAGKFGYTDETFTSSWKKKNADGTYSAVDLRNVDNLNKFLRAQNSISNDYKNWRVQARKDDNGDYVRDANGNPELYWEQAKYNDTWVEVNPFTTTDAGEKNSFRNFIKGHNVSTYTNSDWHTSVDITGGWNNYTITAGAGFTGTNTAADTSVGLSKDTVAFSFEIYDGTQKEAMKDMTTAEKEAYVKAHTVSYTYADLMGDGTTEGVTFNDLAAKINSISGSNIKASYDAVHDKFSFYNTKSGEDNGIVISFGEDESYTNARASLAAKNFFNNMGLYVSKNGELYGNDKGGDGTLDAATEGDGNTLTFSLKDTASSSDGVNSFMGENGSMKIDGVTYNDVVDNKVTVAGVTYTAVNTTLNKDANGNVIASNPATITVTQDTDSIIDKVKSFVTDYNKLLADLYAKYDEKPNSDYKPLTQSQKDQMKDEQITKWEEKAKAGLLYHDQTLGKIIMNMRSAVAESVEGVDGKYNSIFSLGISTTGIKGQLVLDEDKLKKALAEDPDAVYNVFAKLDSQNLDDSAKSGVAQRLGDIFVSANKSIKERAGSTADITEDSDLNNLLRNLQTKMSNFKKLMSSFEDALYKKYDAMESTIARLGTQLNYIMGGQS
ncbi:MAG: flagellar filament capping protein FliD [Selenomonadaceae bacterium]|nr:flagellar filament capping protein FliD [Selenomonadaceae bacterium]